MVLMLITGCPEMASYAYSSGVECIFVDLEIEGKIERQGGLNTVISGHDPASVGVVREAVPDAELLVRLNPASERSRSEINEAIHAGANTLMLPMFTNMDEIAYVAECIDGRARLIPLVETPAAMIRIDQIASHPGVDEVYIGLNDMHLAMQLDFMFELLAEGLVDFMTERIRKHGKPFGFGGLATLDAGLVPGIRVLGEHARLGSSRVILSRDFHRSSTTIEELRTRIDLPAEVQRVRSALQELNLRDSNEVEANRVDVIRMVREAAQARGRARRGVEAHA
jgi:2-keto-3-deoxy-L-rhamnonate aldolase RhmA